MPEPQTDIGSLDAQPADRISESGEDLGPSEVQGGSIRCRIFVTVGTDLPFDRLVKTVDQWAAANDEVEVFAQIGETEFKPKRIAYSKLLEPAVFKQKFTSADLIVSHAGMGTILSSLQFRKPLLVMPRKASLGEHRNEHQLATAKYLTELGKINVAADENELLDILQNGRRLQTRDPIGPYADESLTDAIKAFIRTA